MSGAPRYPALRACPQVTEECVDTGRALRCHAGRLVRPDFPAPDPRSLPVSESSPAPADPETRRRGLSRRGLFAATAASVPAAGVVATTAPALAAPDVSNGQTAIVDVALADVELTKVDVDGRSVEVREVPDLTATMLGLTWPPETGEPLVTARGLTVEGEWTEWCELETATDPETGEDVPGTEVGWLGEVTAIQVRAEIEESDVTEALTAHIVTTSSTESDDDLEGGDVSTATPSVQRRAARAAGNPTTPSIAGGPGFIPRARWGADESSVRGTSAASSLKGIVIHHTAGTNSYTKSQSAQIVRGILSYHTGTLGWADIGYNVLVDKYGQVFEGRSGGLHLNIIGAHALGFNTRSFGISLMGDYSSRSVPSAAITAISKVAGWKLLSTFFHSTTGSSSWKVTTSGTRFSTGSTQTLPRIFGHRNVNYTACPGDSLYAKLGAIRSGARSIMDGGWQYHRDAFDRAGGSSALGSVVKSAYKTGGYWATILTEGLVLSQGDTARATGYPSEVSQQWQPSWGRPTGAPRSESGHRLQGFENGASLGKGSDAEFIEESFSDVPGKLQFFYDIHQLVESGITTGWPDGTYRPLADIQRDAMVVFLYRALGSPSFSTPSRSPFTDLSPSTMYYKEITWARSEGIVEGWPDGTFRPTEAVQRGAVAAFLYRASGSPSSGTSSGFGDVPRGHQFAREISWLASTGITTGWPDGTFRPDEPIARDAMAAFMIRWMDHQGI